MQLCKRGAGRSQSGCKLVWFIHACCFHFAWTGYLDQFFAVVAELLHRKGHFETPEEVMECPHT